MANGYVKTATTRQPNNLKLEQTIIQYFENLARKPLYFYELSEMFCDPISLRTLVHSLRNLMGKGRLKNLYDVYHGNAFKLIE